MPKIRESDLGDFKLMTCPGMCELYMVSDSSPEQEPEQTTCVECDEDD